MTSPRRWRGGCSGLALLALAARCAPEPEPPPPTAAVETCPADNQAPLRNGPGAARPFDCVTVGATTAGEGPMWPALDALPAPRVYVGANGTAPGGDGTLARPFDTFAAAVGAVAGGGGTVALARGVYDLRETLALPPGVTLAGAGAGATIVRVTGGRAAVVLAAGAGAVRGVGLRFDQGVAVDADVGLTARAGATLTLDDVRVERGSTSVLAEGGTVIGTRVTALDAGFAGISLGPGSRGVFSRLWVHESRNYGIRATGAVIHLADSQITCNGIAGLQVIGAPPAMGGAASCAGDLTAPTGDLMCWRRVAFIQNGGQGIGVAVCLDATSTCRDDTGRIGVEGRLLTVRATRSTSPRSGDGISVGPHVRLALDPDLRATSGRGEGTAVIDNARAGMLVQGPDAVVTIDGARIAGNGGPGVYLQGAARAERIVGAVLEGNTGLGVGVTPSSTLLVVEGNRFLGTRFGALPLASGQAVMFGDGLTLAQRADLRVVNNEFTGNERFAAFMTRVENAEIIGNSGRENRYGLMAYESAVAVRSQLDSNPVGARESAPAVAPPALTDAMTMP